MKSSVMGFLGKSDQISSFLWIWLHLLKKSLMENFIFCAVSGILISPKLLAIFNTMISFTQLKQNQVTNSLINTIKRDVSNFQKLK